MCSEALTVQAIQPLASDSACFSDTLEVSPKQFTEKWLTSYARRLATREKHRTFIELSIRISDKYTGPRGIPGTSLGRTYSMWQEAYNRHMSWRSQSAVLLCLTGVCRFSIRFTDGSVKETYWGERPLSHVLYRKADTFIMDAQVRSNESTFTFVKLFVRTTAPLEIATGLKILEEIKTPRIGNVSVLIRNDSWFLTQFEAPAFDFYGPPEQPPTREEYSKSRTLNCMRLTNQPPSCWFLDNRGGLSAK
jgi:hypothetical protein